ncbi:MAG: glycosyl hydrolase, partial [Chitinophagales bacterium]|nr:glycosyl hydrolase [Chitinophagales bacterium]
FTVAESPLDPDQLWVGTDDGNLQLSLDAGKNWDNVIKNMNGLPANTWVSSIEPGKFDKMTCYVTFEGHTTGDMTPYIFKTADGGKTWNRLATQGIKGFVHKVKEDVINSNLLFVGTEKGLFVSIDGGNTWAQMTANLPDVPVRDIVIDPTKKDLILATHGRGIMIIDDITPIRGINNDVLNAEAYILPSRPNYAALSSLNGSYPTTAGDFSAPNPTDEAVISYYLKDRVVTGAVKLEIYDASGKLISSMDGTKRKGINRVTWAMRKKPPITATGAQIEGNSIIGPMVDEGIYTIKLMIGEKSFTGQMELIAYPKSVHADADRLIQKKLVSDLFMMIEDLAFVNQQIINLDDSISQKLKTSSDKKLTQAMKGLSDSLKAVRKSLVATIEGTAITGEERLRERIGSLYGSIMNFEGKPTDAQLDRFNGLKHDMNVAQKRLDNIYSMQLLKLNSTLKKTRLNELKILSREEFVKMATM